MKEGPRMGPFLVQVFLVQVFLIAQSVLRQQVPAVDEATSGVRVNGAGWPNALHFRLS